MHDRDSNLVKMANQIATFFASQSPNEPEVAAKAVAGHLNLFWAPTMRAHIIEAHDRGDTAQMSPVVDAALKTHRDTLLSKEKHVPGEFEEIFPEGGGTPVNGSAAALPRHSQQRWRPRPDRERVP